MRVRVKLWLEEEGRVLFGEGRQLLLKAVDRNGSLAGAARELDMSYRAAWGRLRASEKRLGFALVEKSTGKRGALKLTPQARELIASYGRLEKMVRGKVGDQVAQLAESLGRKPE